MQSAYIRKPLTEEQRAARKEYYRQYRLNNIEKVRAKDRKRYLADPEKMRNRNKEYYQKNKEAVLAKTKEYTDRNRARILERRRQYYHKNQKEILVRGACHRAAQLGVSFSLTVESIDWPMLCPALGVAIHYGEQASLEHRERGPSLDRLNPNEGYTPENVRVICYRANRIKSDATLRELRSITAYVEAETKRRKLREHVK